MSGVRPVLHSYALRAYPVEHVFAFAAADGWPAVELSAWHFDLDAHKVHADIRHAAEFARRYGVEIHCTNYWAEFTAADESERRHWVETVYNVIDASLAQGIGLVNGSAGWLVADPVDWDADWDWEWHSAAHDTPEQLWSLYEEMVDDADATISGAQLDDLSATASRRTGEPFSLRWILLHLIEEYARHNGHADLIRESIDGATGE